MSKYPKGSLGWIKELGEKNGIYCEGLAVGDVQEKGILKDEKDTDNKKEIYKNAGY